MKWRFRKRRRVRLSSPAVATLFVSALCIAGGAFTLNLSGFQDGRDYVHRGYGTELALLVLGYKFDASLSCTQAPRSRAVTLRADDSVEAMAFLKQRFPECRVTWLHRI